MLVPFDGCKVRRRWFQAACCSAFLFFQITSRQHLLLIVTNSREGKTKSFLRCWRGQMLQFGEQARCMCGCLGACDWIKLAYGVARGRPKMMLCIKIIMMYLEMLSSMVSTWNVHKWSRGKFAVLWRASISQCWGLNAEMSFYCTYYVSICICLFQFDGNVSEPQMKQPLINSTCKSDISYDSIGKNVIKTIYYWRFVYVWALRLLPILGVIHLR